MTTADDLEPEARAVARRVLAREAGASAAPGAVVAATNRLVGQLHAPLVHWLGRDGTDAVLARALAIARAHHPALADVRLEHPGGDRRPGLVGFAHGASAQESAGATAASEAFLVAVFALLTRLVGPELLLSLLRRVWPDERADDAAPSSSVAHAPVAHRAAVHEPHTLPLVMPLPHEAPRE